MTDQTDPTSSPALPPLWGGEAQKRRGPKPSLTLERIAQAAVQIADQDGLEGCTMTRLAQELQVTAMALYRYLNTKSDLYLLMLNEAYGRPSTEDRSGLDWRTRLTRRVHEDFERLLTHPWLLHLPLNEAPVTPNSLAWLDAFLGDLADVALSDEDRLSALLLIEVFVRGQAQLAAYGLSAQRQASGRSYGEHMAAGLELWDLPHLEKLAQRGHLSNENSETEFSRGLALVLDGIEARLQPV